MVGEEQPSKHEKHYIGTGICGRDGKQASSRQYDTAQVLHNMDNHLMLLCHNFRQMLATTWSLLTSMRNGVRHAERCFQR